MLTEPTGLLDVALWALGAAALVIGHVYPQLAPYHYVIAVVLLAIGSIRLLRKLDA